MHESLYDTDISRLQNPYRMKLHSENKCLCIFPGLFKSHSLSNNCQNVAEEFSFSDIIKHHRYSEQK